MNAPLRPARIPEHLYAVCSYFLPRLMFLQSEYAAQVHWGDIALALHEFPADLLDLSSAEFWDEWMVRWQRIGDDYVATASATISAPGTRRMLRSAAACYHWAEFMYFSDVAIKTALRRKVKEYFCQSIDPAKLPMKIGEFTWNSIRIPYYLVLPESAHDNGTVPCMILSNGLDSMTEVEIFAFAEQFLARGIAVFLFDGPGQGIHVGCHPIEIRFEHVAAEILAQLHDVPSIDRDRIGFFGVSFGGYLALRVAKHLGQHVRCVVNYSGGPCLSPYAAMPRRLKEDFRFAFMEPDADRMQTVFDSLALDMSGDVQTDVLSIHGARDDIFPLAGLELVDRTLGHRHTLRVYPTEAHVCLNYLNRNSVEIADWAASKLFPHAQGSQ